MAHKPLKSGVLEYTQHFARRKPSVCILSIPNKPFCALHVLMSLCRQLYRDVSDFIPNQPAWVCMHSATPHTTRQCTILRLQARASTKKPRTHPGSSTAHPYIRLHYCIPWRCSRSTVVVSLDGLVPGYTLPKLMLLRCTCMPHTCIPRSSTNAVDSGTRAPVLVESHIFFLLMRECTRVDVHRRHRTRVFLHSALAGAGSIAWFRDATADSFIQVAERGSPSSARLEPGARVCSL